MNFGILLTITVVLLQKTYNIFYICIAVYGTYSMIARITQIYVCVKIIGEELKILNQNAKDILNNSMKDRDALSRGVKQLKSDYEYLFSIGKLVNTCTKWSLFWIMINIGLIFMNCTYYGLISHFKDYYLLSGQRKSENFQQNKY